MSRKVEVVVPHTLSISGAKEKVDQALAELGSALASKGRVYGQWTEDVMSVSVEALMHKAFATIAVGEGSIHIRGQIPTLFGPFTRNIEAQILDLAPNFLASSKQPSETDIQTKPKTENNAHSESSRPSNIFIRILLTWF